MKQLTYEEWFELNKDEFKEIECSYCNGTGIEECDCCGSEIDCEECDGTGFELSDENGLDSYAVYNSIYLKEKELLVKIAKDQISGKQKK